jgi:hypothetical protein
VAHWVAFRRAFEVVWAAGGSLSLPFFYAP